MFHSLARLCLVVILWASLHGCTTVYRHDALGNTTCVNYAIPSTVAVSPPVIKGKGDEFGCPRRMVVQMEAPGKDDEIHFTLDGSKPLPTSEPYRQALSFIIPREKVSLTVRAIAMDTCGVVSTVADATYGCSGTFLTTPGVSHWFDFPIPWPGKKPYDDVVYEGVELPAGCQVANDIHAVSVKLISEACSADSPPRGVYCETGPAYGEATDGSSGVSLTGYEYLKNSRRLQLKVHSWHLFAFKVRYQVSYSVTGNNCVLPAFTYRTE